MTKRGIYIYLAILSCLLACKSAGIPLQSDPSGEAAEKGLNIRVADGKLVTGSGKEFIPYGVNNVHVWLDEQQSLQALETEIAKSGANTVRLVTSGASWTWNNQSRRTDQKRRLVEKALAAGLVPMIEMHDGTCLEACDYPANDGKMGLKQIVDEWLQADNLQMLKDFEGQLLLNIANEWGGEDESYLNCYMDAITRLRDAGVNNVLVIDAGGCGQNANTLLNYGNELFRHDPLHNLVLSIHLYGLWRTDNKSFSGWTPPFSVEEVIPQLAALEAPVVVGEFGWTGEGSAVNYDPRILMQTCLREGIGWYFWAWNDGEAKPFYSIVKSDDRISPENVVLTEAGEFIVRDPELGFKVVAVPAAGF